MIRIRRRALQFTALLTLAIPFAAEHAAAQEEIADLHELVERYRVDLGDVNRFYSVDDSALKAQRCLQLASDWEKTLAALDWNALSQDARIDYYLLHDLVEADLAERVLRGKQTAEDADFLPFLEPIAALEQGRWSLAPVDGAKVSADLAALTTELKSLEGKLVKEGETAKGLPPLTRPRALRIASRVDDVREALDRYSYHYLHYDPDATWWLDAPSKALGSALDSYRDKLRKEIAGKKGGDDEPLVGEPIGHDRLVAALLRERVAYTPEEIVKIGEQQLAFCDAEMQKAARDLGCDSIAKALDIVKSHQAKPGTQDDYIRQVANESIAFLDQHDLVTIPDLCRETWRVDMMPLSDQRFLPFAAYGGQCMIVNYAADDQSSDDRTARMRDNNLHFTRNVTPHELIPGHHLQGFMGARYRPYRRAFSTPFLGEGWCLYFEYRYLDLGWAKSPEDKLGILFWRRHRAARIIVSLKYHLGTMQPDEMIAFLKDRVGWGDGAAKGEVRRFLEGGYGPLYQCAYMIGGLQLYALHDELVKSGKMTERQFHDAVLHENAIPIELIRARLSGLPLEREAKASWRFMGS